MKSICALVAGLLIPSTLKAEPSSPEISPQVRAVVEYLKASPQTKIRTEEVYAIGNNCRGYGELAGCPQSGTRQDYLQRLVINDIAYSLMYSDYSADQLHSDGVIGASDILFIDVAPGNADACFSNKRGTVPLYFGFRDRSLDGKYDSHFGHIPGLPCNFYDDYTDLEEAEIVQQGYASALGVVYDYVIAKEKGKPAEKKPKK